MRTSLNETHRIELYLSGNMDNGEALLFKAKTILSPELAGKVSWQNKTYGLIKEYGRKQLRAEITTVQHQLFEAPEHLGFRQKIFQLFKRK